MAFLWVKSYLGYSWGAWKVLASSPQLGLPTPVKRRRRTRRAITSVCQYPALVCSWRNWSQWRETVAFTVNRRRFTLPWLVLDLPLRIKDTAIVALDFIAERVLLRLNVAAAANISEGVYSFTARCHSCLCLPAQGSHCSAPFHRWRCLPVPELHWGLTLPTCAGSSR